MGATATAWGAFPTYILTPLPSAGSTVPGVPTTIGYAINSFGQVTGSGFGPSGSGVGTGVRGNRFNAPTGATYLKNANDSSNSGNSISYGLNDSYVAVGTSNGASVTSTVWLGNSQDPTIYPSPGSASTGSYFSAVNNSNQAVGRSGFSTFPSFPNQASFWSDATGVVMLPLDVPLANSSQAYDINNNGQIVGQVTAGVSQINPNLVSSKYARRWDSPTSPPIILPPLNASALSNSFSEAWAISDNGWAVGNGSGGTSNVATLWNPAGEPSGIPDPAGYGGASVYPQDINNSNIVVGIYGTTDYGGKPSKLGSGIGQAGTRRAFIYSAANGNVPLQNLIDPASPPVNSGFAWSALLEANAINNNGQITGFGVANNRSAAFIATPSTFTPTWFNADGNWGDQINWFGYTPNSAGISATFGQTSGNRTVNLAADATVGTLILDSTNPYTFSGPGAINVSTGTAAPGTVTVTGSHTISSTLNLPANVNVSVAPGSTLVVSAVRATDTSGLSRTNLSGGGTLAVSGTYAAGSIDIAPSGGGFAGFVDVANTATLLLRQTNLAAGVTTLRSYVSTGLATGTSGIGASALPANQTLAVFPNSASGVAYYNSYDSLPATNTDVIVRVTYIGDTNVDGIVNGIDLINALEGYSTGLTGWENGDFDYQNGVTSADIAALINVLNLGLPSLPGGPTGTGGLAGVVPEPSQAALALPALFGLRRRRR